MGIALFYEQTDSVANKTRIREELHRELQYRVEMTEKRTAPTHG